jgi:hypothetical protein
LQTNPTIAVVVAVVVVVVVVSRIAPNQNRDNLACVHLQAATPNNTEQFP